MWGILRPLFGRLLHRIQAPRSSSLVQLQRHLPKKLSDLSCPLVIQLSRPKHQIPQMPQFCPRCPHIAPTENPKRRSTSTGTENGAVSLVLLDRRHPHPSRTHRADDATAADEDITIPALDQKYNLLRAQQIRQCTPLICGIIGKALQRHPTLLTLQHHGVLLQRMEVGRCTVRLQAYHIQSLVQQ